MAFKMKKFSGFGNSPLKYDGKLSKKKKDKKTGKDITPSGVEMPVPNFSGNDSTATNVEMPIPAYLTGNSKKKKKSKTESARERYFNQ